MLYAVSNSASEPRSVVLPKPSHSSLTSSPAVGSVAALSPALSATLSAAAVGAAVVTAAVPVCHLQQLERRL